MTINPEKIKQVRDLPRPDILFGITRLPGSQRFFLGSSDFKIYEIDLANPKPEFKAIGAHDSYVTTVTMAGKTLVSGGYDGRLIWWDTDTKTQIRVLHAHAKWIRKVFVSPSGNLLASVADDMVCRLWDAGNGKMIRELKGHDALTPHHFSSMLYNGAFSPDGKTLATVDKIGKILLWETETGKKIGFLEAPILYTWDPTQRRHSIGGIRSVAFSPDGTMIAVGGVGTINNIDGLDGKARVEIFDWKKGVRVHEFPGDRFNGLVNFLRFHPNNDWLLAAGGSNDGFLIFFDVPNKKILRQEKVGAHIHDVVLSETGDTLWAAAHHHLFTFEMKS